jgi:hypothetical protein
MPSQIYADDYGFGRAATGGDASRQVSASSSFGPRQTLRSEEYAALADQLDGVVSTMKSLGGILRQRAGTAGSFDTSTAVGQVGALLKKSKAAILKGEVAQEDEQPEDTQAAIDSATKLLAAAKRILVAAVEDEDEDEASLEKAQASYKKAAARLSALKAKPALAAAATTPAISAKAVEALDAQTNVLKAQLADVIEMLGSRSRSAGSPPNFAVVKASNDAEPSIHSQIAHLQAIGSINTDTAVAAKSLAGRVVLAKNGQGDLAEVKEMISRVGNETVRNLFANI